MVELVFAKQELNATSSQFTPVSPKQQVVQGSTEHIRVPVHDSLNGQYVILVSGEEC